MFVFDQLRSKDLPIRLMVIFILCCLLLLVGKLWNCSWRQLQTIEANDLSGRFACRHARPDS